MQRPEDEIRADLNVAVGTMIHAINLAEEEYPESKVILMVGVEHQDGSGKIIARIPDKQFLLDIATLVGASEPTMEHKAAHFLNKFGLSHAEE